MHYFVIKIKSKTVAIVQQRDKFFLDRNLLWKVFFQTWMKCVAHLAWSSVNPLSCLKPNPGTDSIKLLNLLFIAFGSFTNNSTYLEVEFLTTLIKFYIIACDSNCLKIYIERDWQYLQNEIHDLKFDIILIECVNMDLKSISSTFYSQLFCKKVFSAAFLE